MQSHRTDPTRINQIERTLSDLSTQVKMIKRQIGRLESNMMEIKELIQGRDPATDEDFRNEFKAEDLSNENYNDDAENDLMQEVKKSGLPLNEFLRQAEEMLAKAQSSPKEYQNDSDGFRRILEELEQTDRPIHQTTCQRQSRLPTPTNDQMNQLLRQLNQLKS